MINLKIYNSAAYKAFNFFDDYKALCTAVFSRVQGIFVEDNYFIATRDYQKLEKFAVIFNNRLYLLQQDEYAKTENTILLEHDLFIGKILSLNETVDNVKIAEDVTIKFKINLLNSEIQWVKQFLYCIHEHLAGRESENKTLINHDTIKSLIADVIAHIHTADALIEDSNTGSDYLIAISQEVIKAVQILAKLGGGRAFLRGNVISMLCLFTAFSTVYFKQD